VKNVTQPRELNSRLAYPDSLLTKRARCLRHALVLLLVLFTSPVFSAHVLLVDDDDNAPDVRPVYTTVLNALGVSYDVWDTSNSANEPDVVKLSQYDTVIWFNNDSIGSVAGSGPTGEAVLASYLDNSSCLFISSEEYHWSRGLTGFMSSYLSMASMIDDVIQTMVQGYGDGRFTALGPYTLSCPVINWSHVITPDGTAVRALNGNNGDAAVYKIAGSGQYRTTFRGYPLEAISTGQDLPPGSDRMTFVHGANNKGHA
jgi:hypothetical protein